MDLNKKKILVVEDEKVMAQALTLKLQRAGFDVLELHDGKSALEQLRKESFDLLLLDIMMPELSGYDVLKHLQEEKIELPVFVLSNLSQGSDEGKAKALGAKRYFVKSDTPLTQIVQEVQSILL